MLQIYPAGRITFTFKISDGPETSRPAVLAEALRDSGEPDATVKNFVSLVCVFAPSKHLERCRH